MKKWFTKKKKLTPEKEAVPQLTRYERQSLLSPYSGGALPYEIYDRMEQDSMIQTVLTTKKLGVLAAPWSLVGGAAEVDFIHGVFAAMEGTPETILMQAMDAFAKGWSVQELVFAPISGGIGLAAVRPKDPSKFGLELDAFGQVQSLVLHLSGETPRTVDRSRFVLYRHRASYSRPKGRSDLDAIHRHWEAKNVLHAAWKMHLERFASPTVLGRYSRGLPVEEQVAINDSFRNLNKLTSIVFPNEIEVSTLGGDRGSSTGFQDAIDHHNREMARAVLGNTLTVDEGRKIGAMTLGRIHLQVLQMQLAALRQELADTVLTQQVIKPLIELNFDGGEVPQFVFEASEASAFARAEIAQ